MTRYCVGMVGCILARVSYSVGVCAAVVVRGGGGGGGGRAGEVRCAGSAGRVERERAVKGVCTSPSTQHFGSLTEAVVVELWLELDTYIRAATPPLINHSHGR